MIKDEIESMHQELHRGRRPPQFKGDRPRFGDRVGYHGSPPGVQVEFGSNKGGATPEFQPSSRVLFFSFCILFPGYITCKLVCCVFPSTQCSTGTLLKRVLWIVCENYLLGDQFIYIEIHLATFELNVELLQVLPPKAT